MDGKIYLPDGEVMECMIDLPIRAALNKITIKKNEDAKPESMSSNEIDMLLLISGEQEMLLKRTQVLNIKAKGTKLSKGKVWLEVTKLCENITSYLGIVEFDVDRKGYFFGLSVDGMGGHYLQRKGEHNPTEVGFVFSNKQITQKGIDSQRKLKLARYFSNDKTSEAHFKAKKQVSESEIIGYIDSICR